ncbi:MAG: N-acetylglucosamine-6-phosphate deacetylase [Devosiaceae bacterium]|nr:N-acetylglucosamine-6-phosphate deacetylase [Devosiaceae bacterium]
MNSALLIDDMHVSAILPSSNIPSDCKVIKLDGGLLSSGFVDLQVNGGGGKMFNSLPGVETIRTICDAHIQFGTTSLLPTLITDTKAQTDAAINAAKDAIAQDVPGAIGLHLEGPHLSVARKGAHDPSLIRVMTDSDCQQLADLATELPSLMLTVATESVSMEQIERLNHAGATVSLGHTDADFQTVIRAQNAGVTCVTHLFNAMSQLVNRAPGMVGAALDSNTLWAGLIADGIHVDAATIRVALRAKNGPGKVFLVSDSMATLGTELDEFTLNGRKILRRDGRLVLHDGTLAGADLDMISAVRFMIDEIGIHSDEALRMASLYPAQVLNRSNEIGRLGAGTRADFIHLGKQLDILSVWRGGTRMYSSS